MSYHYHLTPMLWTHKLWTFIRMRGRTHMSINIIKKIRYIFLVIIGILIFIGAQISTNRYGDTANIMEALFMAIIMVSLLYLMSTDWLYYNHLRNKNIKINYYTFHIVGLFILFCTLCIIAMATYNGIS